MRDQQTPTFGARVACKTAGVRLKDLQEYERQGLVVPVSFDTRTKRPRYDAQNIYDLNFIRRALLVGLTLRQIKYMLRVRGTPETQLYICILEHRRKIIDGLISDLKTAPRRQ